MPSVTDGLGDVTARIARAAERAGRDPADVEIVAVTKGHAVGAVRAALTAGLASVGESRAQELLAKHAELEAGGDPVPEWHFVGRIQRNKIKRLAPLVSVWHSVDREEVGETLATHAPAAKVYVQVNVGGEANKGGCSPDGAAALVEALSARGLQVEGLMTVPPLADDPRPHFARLRELAAEAGVAGLSMGMSGDFEVAVEEGASIVRLGEILVGPRSPVRDLRR